MKNPAVILLGGIAFLAVLVLIIPKPEDSKLEVGSEVSYWMNFAEPGELPTLKPFGAIVKAVHEDGTADLLVLGPRGTKIPVAKADRASRATAGCWTRRP
jgi:hypothetical protein